VGDSRQYGVSLSDTHSASGNTVSLGGSRRGNTMTIAGNLSRGPTSTQTSIMADGGIVVHSGGVAFANMLGDTVGLVHAPSAPGASVLNSPGSQVNGDGYAVVPYLTPYTMNSVEVDMSNAPPDSQLDSTVEQAVPRKGAVVLLEFKGRRGRNVLIETRAEDGRPLPFSAAVTDESGRAVGLVGQGSRIEANVSADSGQLTVRWGDELADQCTVTYRLPPATADAPTFTRAEGVCRNPQRDTYSRNSGKP
jgi:outer membrane usher protein